ncbi:type 11 methyltransferase [Alcanivorax hongdengensis A-11-3]|uniref:Type 11 methyltransferase n=1 Tax=Alcanivorax hongdengensis A-11-3 TaxID=1177179 RepID=L0WGE8_9GAMM|nr:class I SAM-dependent methyltransferase [Alcanivorax hongdengensis]EKF75799.1 type 11 methyltransferase [Alcanivorax hongdengensis A-11-3]
MSQSREGAILASWQHNAAPWSDLVRRHGIASRRHTDPAIVQAALQCQPRSVLDVGCGEGWLCRTLAAEGLQVTGVDAIEALVQRAREQHPLGHYQCLDYQALAEGALPGRFDLAICNFSLFGDASVSRLLQGLHRQLNDGGTLLIQTLHPVTSCQGDYRDGWRPGSWQGCDGDFRDPPPWYFRTLGSWLKLLDDSGYRVTLHEPLDPHHGVPLSALLQCRPDHLLHEYHKS